MDIKKFKSFIAPGLRFGNPVRSSKPQRTLREIRVFDQVPAEPVCPICGYLLEDYRKQSQTSLDKLPIKELTEGGANQLKPYTFDWRCQACAAPVIFNKDMVSNLEQDEDKTINNSRWWVGNLIQHY